MKDHGKMVKQMAMGNCTMQMETSTKANGSKIKQMGKEYILMLMVQNTMEIG